MKISTVQLPQLNDLILENFTDSIIIIDLEGKIQYWNKGAEEIFHLKAEEVIGKGVDVLYNTDPVESKKYFQKVLEEKEVKNEWEGTRKDGSKFWLLVKTTLLKDKDGETIGYLGVSKDITEKKEFEQKVIKNESRYRKLLESAPVAIIVIQNNKIEFANKAAANLVQAENIEQLYSHQLMDFVHPDSKANVANRIVAVMSGEEITISEHKVIDLKGNIKEIESIGSLIDYEGKPAIQVIMHDISERNKAIAALKANEEKLTKITNEVPGIVYQLSVNKEGKTLIEFISNSKKFKIAEINRIAKIEDVYPYIYPTDLENFKLSIRNSIANKSSWDHEFRFIYNNATSWVRGTSAVEEVENGTLKYTGFLKDINERKKIEQEIQKKNEKLNQLTQHLEKIRDEEKRKISREIHDGIGQELTGIKLELFWLKKKLAELENNNTLPVISKKVDHLIEIVGNTIENTRRIAHDLRPVLLDNLGLIPALEWLIQNFSNWNNIECISKLDLNGLELSQDATNTIFRIFQESLNNISKYAGADKTYISLVSDDENIIINIKDNGVGINLNELEHTNKLGLFNIKERVRDYNGEFNLNSKLGTEIEISLPIKNIIALNE